ncbi:ABC transporter permease [Flavihumibacter petaseus]|uniref:Transport permease protein n=1 Tax=Flavihumibacter petaseus NBRC 106054 TaxID=1220578 RepID=A0A0E9N5W8_9BACT|nr:ABC transporter permease [Flavihumibacter petaseus]GAO45198.1 putative polysaccharide ABC transporter permease protein [Flavihumibacter petaseus NBRC 106054]
MSQKENWDWKITADTSWLGVSVKDLIDHRDLLWGFVRKDFLNSYQQTLLGPLWILLQPLLAVWVYVLVFDRIIGVSTNGVPAFLYYLIGSTLWTLFSDIFSSSSSVIAGNLEVFSKVYFPRLIAPLSGILYNFLRFTIHFIFLLLVTVYYKITGGIDFNLFRLFLALPAVIVVAGIAFGAGLIFSILTTKYRDLNGFVSLFLRLLMFLCPIFYTASSVPEKLKLFVFLNPLTAQFELFRYAFIGKGQIMGWELIYSVGIMVLLVTMGILFFNKMTDRLIDVA